MNDYAHVTPGGYAWWYFDALSDDGRWACAAIFLVGSVFSPDYAARLRNGENARAEEHVAVNLAVYERGKPCVWVMSEYGERALTAGNVGPRIGRSSITRASDGKLRVEIRERSAPFLIALTGKGSRVDGDLEVEPLGPSLPPIELQRDLVAGGKRHLWHAVAPRARFKVRLDRPRISFDGIGYHDINAGDGRLEDAFKSWSWARFHDGARTTIGYAVRGLDGKTRGLVAQADEVGARTVEAALSDGAPRSAGWGLSLPANFTLTPPGGNAIVCTPGKLWDAAPFYARYAAGLSDGERNVEGMGEHLDLERFAGRGVQFLLRFKTRLQRR